jgi:hypothetical protein
LCVIEEEFIPTLSEEHIAYAWANIDYAPKPLHQGVKISLGNKIIKTIIKKPAYMATIICTFLINKFYSKNFTDIIGGKFYKTSSVKRIPIDSFHAGFDFEFFSRICKKNLKIKEIFIKYKPRKFSSEKKIKFYHMLSALYEIFKVKLFN